MEQENLTDSRPLSLMLREDSKEIHNRAENSGFVTKIMGGKLNREGWLLLICQYKAVYQALEDACDNLRGARADFDMLLEPGLNRTARIRRDIAAVCEMTGHKPYPVLPATLKYENRIREIADNPARILAHHYTRYLGDLSGGQVMKRFFEREYGLDSNALSFFVFDEIAKGPVFKREYRNYVDALDFTAGQKADAVSETLDAFAYNEDMFSDCMDVWRAEFGEPKA